MVVGDKLRVDQNVKKPIKLMPRKSLSLVSCDWMNGAKIILMPLRLEYTPSVVRTN